MTPGSPKTSRGPIDLGRMSRQNLGVDTQECLGLGDFGIPLGELIGGEELHDAFAYSPADGLQLLDDVGLGDIGMSLADLIEPFSSVLESRLKLFFLILRKIQAGGNALYFSDYGFFELCDSA